MIEIVAAALIEAQSVLFCIINCLIPTDNVLKFLSCMKTLAIVYSFHTFINVKTLTDTIPGSENGSVKALIVAFVPRILIGLVAAVLYQVLHSKGVSDKKACFVCGIVGSSVNTVFVIVFIYLLFGAQYAAALGATYELLIGLLMGVVVVNGIPELIIASILTAAVCCPILRMQQKKR